jgi:hypothetical protein
MMSVATRTKDATATTSQNLNDKRNLPESLLSRPSHSTDRINGSLDVNAAVSVTTETGDIEQFCISFSSSADPVFARVTRNCTNQVDGSELAGIAAVEKSAVGLIKTIPRKDSDMLIDELALKIIDVVTVPPPVNIRLCLNGDNCEHCSVSGNSIELRKVLRPSNGFAVHRVSDGSKAIEQVNFPDGARVSFARVGIDGLISAVCSSASDFVNRAGGVPAWVGPNISVGRKRFGDANVFVLRSGGVLASHGDAENRSDRVPAGADHTFWGAVTDCDFVTVLQRDGDRHLLSVGDCENGGVCVFDGDLVRVPVGDLELVGVRLWDCVADRDGLRLRVYKGERVLLLVGDCERVQAVPIGQRAVMNPACENVAVFVLVTQLTKNAVMFGRLPENKHFVKVQGLLQSVDASLVLLMKVQFVTVIHPYATASAPRLGLFE